MLNWININNSTSKHFHSSSVSLELAFHYLLIITIQILEASHTNSPKQE